jgi:DNA helicase HerA-like ATPase
LQVLAEGLSRAGVSVFAADVKGDLSGVSEVGEAKEAFVTRAKSLGFDYEPDQFPVVFWDLFGEQGHPIRATISEVGPLLLSRLMDLNDVQEGVINICFRVADEQGLLILDLKDLRAVLGFISDHAAELTVQYGNVSKATIGTIQRELLVLENQGGSKFFGEPALALKDFIRTDRDGRGFINILAADKLMESPRLYATFLLWLLSELFEELPEIGDPPKPKLCFFFDEAHLLFNDAPKALLDKIEQVVRLIRSKGVGVYFVTQNPLDVPDKVLAQLGNRVQHALRAFTPRDQKAVRAAAETFRANPKLDTAKVIMELGKGEALVSFLEGNGTPSMVERCVVRPPSGRLGPITPEERKVLIATSPLKGKYDQAIDSESAYEVLQQRMRSGAADGPLAPPHSPGAPEEAPPSGGLGAVLGGLSDMLGGIFGTSRPRGKRLSTGQVVAREVTRSVTNRVAGQIAADIGKSLGGRTGSSVGRAIVRGTMGGILRR